MTVEPLDYGIDVAEFSSKITIKFSGFVVKSRRQKFHVFDHVHQINQSSSPPSAIKHHCFIVTNSEDCTTGEVKETVCQPKGKF